MAFLLFVAKSAAYVTLSIKHRSKIILNERIIDDSTFDEEENMIYRFDDDSDAASFANSLSERIARVDRTNRPSFPVSKGESGRLVRWKSLMSQ
jgi:hypothetical protein